jgi:GTP-binding protein HflX
MQVELAQLEYSLPRLKRMWTHLEKFRGGIGVRGPGETQLETDRRLINHRIKSLRLKLEEVRKARDVQRQGRRLEFRASLVGYTNAGKSSLLRALTQADDVFIEDRLFATLDPLTREANLGAHRVLVTDTVGFIRKLPHHLVASFRATLEETTGADLLLHVVDVSSEHWESHMEVVDAVLADLGVHDKPVIHVFNKTDLLEAQTLTALKERMQETLQCAVFVSAHRNESIEPLRLAIAAMVRRARPEAQVHLPIGDGRTLAELHREAEVLEQRTEGGEMIIRAVMDNALAGRLRSRGLRVSTG